MKKIVLFIFVVINLVASTNASSDLTIVNNTQISIENHHLYGGGDMTLLNGPTCSSGESTCSCAEGQTCSAGGGSCSCQSNGSGGDIGDWVEAFIEWLIELILK